MAVELARIPAPQRGPAVPLKAAAIGLRGRLARLGRVSLSPARGVTPQDLLFFTQQLALLLETGNPLAPSLGALARQSPSPALQRVLTDVHARLEAGTSLSDALRQHPREFDNLFVSLVCAGEATGSLRPSLERIAGILEVRQRLRARIREAMAYPCVLLAVMGVTLIFMFVYIIPRFATIFADMGNKLPASTRLLLWSSEFLRSSWMWSVPILVVMVALAPRLARAAPMVRMWDWLRPHLPLIGPLTRAAGLYQLFSSFGLLLGSRVPLMEAIGITREIVRGAQFESFFARLVKHVEDGQGIASGFAEASFLPETVKLMMATGEQSGAMDVVTARLAQYYREELEAGIRRLSVLLEPIMLVVMGAMVGFVAISFIVPIFKMSRSIH